MQTMGTVQAVLLCPIDFVTQRALLANLKLYLSGHTNFPILHRWRCFLIELVAWILLKGSVCSDVGVLVLVARPPPFAFCFN